MAWRNTRYSFLHAGRDALAAGISSANAFETDQPKDFLIDGRAGSLAKFAASAADHYIQIDRGAVTPEAIDRLVIPNGHNLGGTDLRVRADDNPTLTSATLILDPAGDGLSVSSGLIDLALTSNTERYVRLDWPNDTLQPEIGELWFTRIRTTDAGPEPGWEDFPEHNMLSFPKESGAEVALSLGPDRQFYRFTYRNVKLAADLAVFSELIAAVGTSLPFILDPPFDTEAARFVRLAANSDQQQDPQVPAATNATQRQIVLSIREHIA